MHDTMRRYWCGRAEFERVLLGRRFAFSVLVHADESSPMVDFLATSSVLQACHCCICQIWLLVYICFIFI